MNLDPLGKLPWNRVSGLQVMEYCYVMYVWIVQERKCTSPAPAAGVPVFIIQIFVF
jgi:hypothetical protein